MIYLRKFETQAAYEAAQSGLILPNVSLTVDNNTVHYNPSTPPTPSHEYVDLGLPSGTLWARYNVGATSETDYGDYYQYGKGADDYSVTSGQSIYSGTENPLATSADTAAQVWGGNWHIPTTAQCQELIDNTTYEWTTINGVNGGKFTAQNGNYIFIPEESHAIHYGNIITSTPNGEEYYRILYFEDGWVNANDNAARDGLGLPVRPVIG